LFSGNTTVTPSVIFAGPQLAAMPFTISCEMGSPNPDPRALVVKRARIAGECFGRNRRPLL
jgi:hypothetical protein